MRTIVNKRAVRMTAVWTTLTAVSLGAWYLICQAFVWLGGKAMVYL